jgi:hypothetical protein
MTQEQMNTVGVSFGGLSVFSRVFWYLLSGLGLGLFIIITFALSSENSGSPSHPDYTHEYISIFIPLIFIFFIEWHTQMSRKRYGLSWWKGYLRTGWSSFGDFNENMVRLGNLSPFYGDWVKKNPDYGVDVSRNGGNVVVADKSDVGYWYGLLEKGAITQEQYEVKRAELLK